MLSCDWPGEPLFGSIYGREEREAINRALEHSTDALKGFRARDQIIKFEDAFAQKVNGQHAVAFNSFGSALEAVLHWLDLGCGDEVISASIGFHGTHLAILRSRASLVLALSKGPSLNICVDDLHSRITPRTKAVVVTHMNGLPAEIDKIQSTIRDASHKLGIREPFLIFDSARGVRGSLSGAWHVEHMEMPQFSASRVRRSLLPLERVVSYAHTTKL